MHLCKEKSTQCWLAFVSVKEAEVYIQNKWKYSLQEMPGIFSFCLNINFSFLGIHKFQSTLCWFFFAEMPGNFAIYLIKNFSFLSFTFIVRALKSKHWQLCDMAYNTLTIISHVSSEVYSELQRKICVNARSCKTKVYYKKLKIMHAHKIA